MKDVKHCFSNCELWPMVGNGFSLRGLWQNFKNGIEKKRIG